MKVISQNIRQILTLTLCVSTLCLVFWLTDPLGLQYDTLTADEFSIVPGGNDLQKPSVYYDTIYNGFITGKIDSRQTHYIVTLNRKGSYYITCGLIDSDTSRNAESVVDLYKNDEIAHSFLLKPGQIDSILIRYKTSDRLEIKMNSTGSSPRTVIRGIKKVHTAYFYAVLVIGWILFFWIFTKRKKGLIALLSVLIFWAYIAAEKNLFGTIPLPIITHYAVLSILSGFLFSLIMSGFKSGYVRISTTLTLIVFIALLTIPAAVLLHNAYYGVPFVADSLTAILQTNMSETAEYLYTVSNYLSIIITAFTLCLAYILLYKQEKTNFDSFRYYEYALLFVGMCAYSYLFIPQLRLSHFIMDSSRNYFVELDLFKELQMKRQLDTIKIDSQKSEKGETYVFIIGESLNREHMGIYGYFRNTTPHLSALKDKGELLVFEEPFSNQTHTVEALKLALTEANQLNGKDFFNSLSLIEVLNAADFETYWISNQVRYGGWDNIVSIIADDATNIRFLNKNLGFKIGNSYDEILLPTINNFIKSKPKSHKNRAIFIHLMGSHHGYWGRYPANFDYYHGPIRAKEADMPQDITNNPLINEYDNSVRYTDSIVDEIYKSAKSNGASAVVYFSDHGEDVYAQKYHSSSIFTYPMTYIPFVMWLSPQFKQRYPEKCKTIQGNLSKPISNDLFYDSFLGLMSVKTNHYQAKYDITDPHYDLPEDSLLTLHGKVRYKRKTTRYYWQDTTIKVEWIKKPQE